jgi:hypothetical protein
MFDGSAASLRVAMDKQKHDLVYQIATAGLVVAFFVLMLFLRR